jgi:hypothetical protein
MQLELRWLSRTQSLIVKDAFRGWHWAKEVSVLVLRTSLSMLRGAHKYTKETFKSIILEG